MTETVASPAVVPDPIRSMMVEDRKYELHRRYCESCGKPHLEVWRWSGVSFACYFFPLDVDEDAFETFVSELDEHLLLDSADLLTDLEKALRKLNTPHGIHADGSFAFLLLEYARQRAVQLSKLGHLKLLRSKRKPRNRTERALRLAFELGSAAAEYRVMEFYEDYMWEGVNLSEARELGLPRAREERLRQGQRTRSAIKKVSAKLYAEDASLVRNDMKTARAIQKLRLPELDKGNGQQLGLDAITKHLRALRAENQPAH